MRAGNFLDELKRRNVYKVGVAYLVGGWALSQGIAQLFPVFDVPTWVIRLLLLAIILGLPVALGLAWAFEISPEGIKRTREADATAGAVRPQKHAWLYVVVIGGFVSAGLFFLGRYSAAVQSGQIPVPLGKSIAVLPFDNLSRDPDSAYFADGIQDEILTRLAKIADLKVISRTSTQRYKNSTANLPEIAKQLGVAHILEGSVQKAGDQVRVSVQLIRAETDAHLWAETYDRSLTDIFAVESEIAENIARSLRAKLSPLELQAVAARSTSNTAAYEEYLRGVALWNKLTGAPKDLEDTVTHFSRAVELDPNFVLAWSLLSVGHTFLYAEVDRTEARAALAKETLARAERLNPELGEVHFAEGMYRYRVLREYDKALASFEKARARGANRVTATEFSAYVKRRQGKWDEALRFHEESLDLDPRNPLLLSEASVTYRALRRLEETNSLVDRAREIEPENPLLLIQKAEVALAQGDLEQARRFIEPIPVDGRQPALVSARFYFYLVTHQYSDAIRMFRQLLDMNLPPSLAVHYRARLGISEALAGNQANAQIELERARDELLALRAEGDASQRIGNSLIIVLAFLKDKAGVDREAANFREEIASDALIGPILETTIAAARAQLGEIDAAIASLQELLQKPGEDAVTPALLREDPRWDPLRRDPRFAELIGARK